MEKKFEDYYLVHDGGKTASAFASHGVAITQRRQIFQSSIADAYGVYIGGRLLQRSCNRAELTDSILAVAQCSTMMTAELAHFTPAEPSELWKFADEALSHPPAFVRSIEKNKKIRGETTLHSFNYVANPADQAYRTAAIKLLAPTHPPSQARGFGFLALDIRDRADYRDWGMICVVPRVEIWTKNSLGIVRRFSAKTIELKTGEERYLSSHMPIALEEAMSR